MKNIYTLSLLASLASFGVAPAVSADSVSSLPFVAADLERLEGKIGAITDESFDLMVGEVRHSVRVDEQTKFKLDGKDSTRAEVLVQGRSASVELDRGRATKVEAKSSLKAALPESVKGKVRSVGEESFVIMVEDQAQTITINANTKYWLDEKESRKGDVLVVDRQVSVELTDGVATKVSARSKS